MPYLDPMSLFLDSNTSADWTLRHGRGMALGIALKEGAEKIWTEQYRSGVKNAISLLVESDRVSYETEFKFTIFIASDQRGYHVNISLISAQKHMGTKRF